MNHSGLHQVILFQAPTMPDPTFFYIMLFTGCLSSVLGLTIRINYNTTLRTIPPVDTNVNILNLNLNAITRVENNSLVGLSELDQIHLHYNPLYFIDDEAFIACPKLTVLNMQRTNTLVLLPDMASLPSLIVMGATGMGKYMYIYPTNFATLSNMEILLADRNYHLDYVPNFAPNTPIGSIDMRDSPIKTVPDLSRLPKLVTLRLKTDSLLCDSRLCWLKFESFNITTRPGQYQYWGGISTPQNDIDPAFLICNTPPHSGTPFRDINPVQLECYNSKLGKVNIH